MAMLSEKEVRKLRDSAQTNLNEMGGRLATREMADSYLRLEGEIRAYKKVLRE